MPLPASSHHVAPPLRGVLAGAATALAAAVLTVLAGCGQKGDLFIPDTPAAAQRATLPQTVFGGAAKNKTKTGQDDNRADPGDTDDRPAADAGSAP